MLLHFRELTKRVDDYVYSRAIEWLGGGAEAYARLASRYEALQWWAEAAEAYKKVIHLSPYRAAYRIQLARVLYDLGRFPEAVEVCREALRLDSELPFAYVIQGMVYQKTRETEKAIECFKKAKAYPLNDAALYHTIGKAFADAGLYEDAAQAYSEVVRISPRSVSAYGVMAETYAKLNRYPEALHAYRQAVQIKPTADSYGILASAYARMGMYREAVQAYQEAMRLEPGLAQPYNRLAEVYIKLDDFQRQLPAGAAETNKTYTNLCKEREALENFKDAIRRQPGDATSYVHVAELYLELEWPQKAVDYLQHALRLRSDDSSTHRLLGKVYMHMGRNEEALKEFKEALRRQKDDSESWTAIGRIHLRSGQYKKSIEAFRAALPWTTQKAAVHGFLGDALRGAGRYPEAAQSYWQVIYLDPQDVKARYGLGVAYVRMNQRSHAVEQRAVLKTLDARMAAELDHMIWRLMKGDS